MLLVGVLLEEETDVVGEFLTISQVFRMGGCVGERQKIFFCFSYFYSEHFPLERSFKRYHPRR